MRIATLVNCAYCKIHMTTPERFSVQNQVCALGENKGKSCWYVVVDGHQPIGNSWDFCYEPGLLVNPFPFIKLRNEFTTQNEALQALEMMREHVHEVCTKQIKQKPIVRQGSSATWII